jgi:hypothetical protein
VSDPADSTWGRVCDAQAGSLTPLLSCNTCTRALTGRHRTPPDADDGAREKLLPRMHLPAAYSLWFVTMEARATLTRR